MHGSTLQETDDLLTMTPVSIEMHATTGQIPAQLGGQRQRRTATAVLACSEQFLPLTI